MQHLVCQGSPSCGGQIRGHVARRLVLGLVCLLLTHSAIAQDASPPTARSGEAGASDVALRAVIIPTGFQEKKYSAMIQIAVDGSPLPGATWDLGASFVSNGRAAEDFSGRVVAGEPGERVVLEFLVEFMPGPYALTLTAHETTAGQSATQKLNGGWPDPDEQGGAVSPVVLLQPAQGAFLRGESARGQGALALGEKDLLRTQLPTAIVSVVCRGAKVTKPVRVERKLEATLMETTRIPGNSDGRGWRPVSEFKTHLLSPGEEQCAQIRDMITPGTLQAGRFRYGVRLVTDSGRIGSGVLWFDAVDGAPDPGPGS